MKKYLSACLFLLCCILNKEKSFAQTAAKITAAEYFFDNDPGTDSATAISINTADSIVLNLSFATSSLSGGFHQLFIRFKDANNLWSIAEQRTFYIDSSTKAKASRIKIGEYFFDKDPGVAKATFIPPFATADSINALYSLSTAGLKSGFHQLFIRYRDSANKWSIAEQRSFYVDNSQALALSPIVAGEYFFTKDKGVGKGTPLVISQTDSINQTFSITVPTLSAGRQFLEIRFKDSTGKWSIAESRKIMVTANFNSEKEITDAAENKPAISAGIYPNPTKSYAFLNFSATKESKFILEVMEISGKILISKEGISQVGENKITIDLSKLAAATYFVYFIDEENIHQNFKVVKQ